MLAGLLKAEEVKIGVGLGGGVPGRISRKEWAVLISGVTKKVGSTNLGWGMWGGKGPHKQGEACAWMLVLWLPWVADGRWEHGSAGSPSSSQLAFRSLTLRSLPVPTDVHHWRDAGDRIRPLLLDISFQQTLGWT